MKADSLDHFRHVATVAATEPAPPLDVSSRVLQTLYAQSASRLTDRDLVTCGAASVVAAGIAMSVFWVESIDASLLSLVQPFVSANP